MVCGGLDLGGRVGLGVFVEEKVEFWGVFIVGVLIVEECELLFFFSFVYRFLVGIEGCGWIIVLMRFLGRFGVVRLGVFSLLVFFVLLFLSYEFEFICVFMKWLNGSCVCNCFGYDCLRFFYMMGRKVFFRVLYRG